MFLMFDIIKINLGKQIIFQSFAESYSRLTDHIVSDRTGTDLRIKNLVCLKFFIDHIDSRFFFKDRQDLRINVFAPVIDNQLFIIQTSLSFSIIKPPPINTIQIVTGSTRGSGSS